MKKADKKWTDFHFDKINDDFPSWPVEVMVKVLFGNYAEHKKDINSDSSVLDVGCGFGNNLMPFLVKGCNCAGVEVSDEIAQLTQKILSERGFENFNIVEGHNRELPFENDQFDLLISNNVLHYEANEANILKGLEEYARVLKQNGSLFLMTVAPNHLIYRNAKALGNHQYQIADYDFRDGEVYFYFDNEKYLRLYLEKFFTKVETGRVTEKLMNVEIDFFVATAHGLK